tara:strand:+ start:326 stop:571 length:246 start_codon:yes stop_codon:yes gene_type:complete
MKPKFNYNDIVKVRTTSDSSTVDRQGEQAWIVGVFTERPSGEFFKKFPPGIVYSIEFEDGSSIEVHEKDLILVDANPGSDS